MTQPLPAGTDRPLSNDDINLIDNLFAIVIDNPECFDESMVDFVDDNVARFDRYKSRMRISKKQWRMIDRIIDRAAEEGFI